MDRENLNAALDGVDETKRSTLKRLIGTGAFVAPIIASFAMSGLTIEHAAAQSNTTASGRLNINNLSDRRLKTVIARVGMHQAGFGLYRFRYLWSATEYVGVVAQEVLEVRPDAVVLGGDGFLRVDYDAIGVKIVPYANWHEQEQLNPQAFAA